MNATSSTFRPLEPWVVLAGEEAACWELTSGPKALAIFSTAARAERYHQRFSLSGAQSLQLPANRLVSLLAQCWQQGIRYAVLDPDEQGGQKLFDLGPILRTVRDDLRDGREPDLFRMPLSSGPTPFP